MVRRVGLVAFLCAFCLCGSTFSGERQSKKAPVGAIVTAWTSFNLDYTVRDIGGTGAKKVEFYITTDMGKTWKLYGEDPDAKSPMRLSLPGEGIYGIRIVGTDMVGNRERDPVSGDMPEKVIVIDRTVPSVKWISPAKDQLLDPRGIVFEWETSDENLPASPVSILFSSDSGSTWLPLRDNLPAKGRRVMKAPIIGGGSLIFKLVVRDVAGNAKSLENKARVILDNIAPTVTITGPDGSGDLSVDVNYEAVDNPGGTGIEKVTLWYTIDNGKSWNMYGNDMDLKSPVTFTSKITGRVGLTLVAIDKARNASPSPTPGASPMHYIEFDRESPIVSLDPQLPGGKSAIRGGITVPIRFSATDQNIKSNSANIYFSQDGGRTWGDPVATSQPLNIPYEWNVPKIDSKSCMVKVTASDTMGNVGEAVSMSFTIDSVPPRDLKITSVDPVRNENGTGNGPINEDDNSSSNGNGGATNNKLEPGREIDPDNIAPLDIRTDDSFDSAKEVVKKTANETTPVVAESSVTERKSAAGTSPVGTEPALPIDNQPALQPLEKRDERPVVAPTNATAIAPIPEDNDVAVNASETEINGATESPAIIKDTTPPLDSLDNESVANNVSSVEDNVPSLPNTDDTATASTDTAVKTVIPDNIPDQRAIPPLPDDNATTAKADVGVDVTDADKKLKPGTLEAKRRSRELSDAGSKYFKDGDKEKARRLCAMSMKLDDHNDMAYLLASQITYARLDYDLSIKYALWARKLNKNNVEHWTSLGTSYYTKARKLEKIYIARLDREAPASETTPLFNNMRENAVKAREVFTQVARMIPQKKVGYISMGDAIYFLARTTPTNDTIATQQLYREAIAAYSKAFAIDKPEYKECVQLGLCHFRLGNWKQAKEYLELAVEKAAVAGMVPKHGFWYLALIHEKLNDDAGALRYWEKAVDSFDGSHKETAKENVRRLKEKLNQ